MSRVSRGQGPVRIRVELERKGVSADLVETHLDGVDRDWVDLARDVRRKRFGDAAPVDYREKARQARFLQHRGFTSEQIHAAFADAD